VEQTIHHPLPGNRSAAGVFFVTKLRFPVFSIARLGEAYEA
jgi:hypothetical protein